MYKKKKKNAKKFRKKFNTRIIKSKKTYSVAEISELLNVHQNTVSVWLKKGLEKIDDQQPYLVFGQDLIYFLNAKNNAKKQPCDNDEFFCCKCQQPHRSKNNIACIKINNCRTNVVGVCEKCGTTMNKTISPQKVAFYKKIFDTKTVLQENLIECANTCAIVDKK